MRIGVDLGGTKIAAVALADDGTEAVRLRVPTPQGDYAATVARVAELVHEIDVMLATPVLSPVGVGTPGAISPVTGRIKNANSTVLNDRPLDVDLVRAVGRPVTLANDADCFALSEATDGAAAGAASVFGVILGTGVGGGVVVRGALHGGPNRIAGEWGHTPLPWPRDDERPGPACYCGRHGCIEQWLSGPAFARDAGPLGAAGAPAVVAAARAGDAAAVAALARYVDRLARGLAVVCDVLDPEVVVLGGGMSNVAEIVRGVAGALGPYVFTDRLLTRVVAARFGDASGVRGAARLPAAARD